MVGKKFFILRQVMMDTTAVVSENIDLSWYESRARSRIVSARDTPE